MGNIVERVFFAALLTLVSLASPPAKAQSPSIDVSESGNRFLQVCSVEEKPLEKWSEVDVLNGGICNGFMMGLRDGIGMTIALLQRDHPSLAAVKTSAEAFDICFPEHSDLGQTVRVTLKYIRQHPEQSHLPSATLVLM